MYNASSYLIDLACQGSAMQVSTSDPRERRRTYVALKGPHTRGLVQNPRVCIVNCDIHLCPHGGKEKQGDQHEEDV
jgi:hypothetical protein